MGVKIKRGNMRGEGRMSDESVLGEMRRWRRSGEAEGREGRRVEARVGVKRRE